MHNRTFWVDQVEDQDGQVIQQGTLIDQAHLNNMEVGISDWLDRAGETSPLLRETRSSSSSLERSRYTVTIEALSRSARSSTRTGPSAVT